MTPGVAERLRHARPGAGRSGQYQEAVKVCRLGLLGRPTTVEGRVVLGQALLALKRYDEVLAEMRVALELDHASHRRPGAQGRGAAPQGRRPRRRRGAGQAAQPGARRRARRGAARRGRAAGEPVAPGQPRPGGGLPGRGSDGVRGRAGHQELRGPARRSGRPGGHRGRRRVHPSDLAGRARRPQAIEPPPGRAARRHPVARRARGRRSVGHRRGRPRARRHGAARQRGRPRRSGRAADRG